MKIYTKLEDKLRIAMKFLEKNFIGKGFAIFTFELGTDKPAIGFISNVRRKEMIVQLRAKLDELEAELKKQENPGAQT